MNLQEILHKLGVLNVAVYLTEMVRIVFETLSQESANLLTAVARAMGEIKEKMQNAILFYSLGDE